MLIEEDAVLEVQRIEVLAADIVIAARRVGIALELADDRARMNVIDARKAHPFGDDAERHAMRFLPRIGGMAGAVQVQDHVVPPRPFGHRLNRGVADDEVDHDDDGAELAGEFGALVHVLHRRGRDVEIGPLHLARRRLRLVHRLHAIEEPVAPVHEGLGVDVLIVLGEVEAALQRLEDDAAVVAAGKPELRLHRRAKQRPAEFVEPLALDDDAGGRPLERLHISDGQAHVLEPQRLERLEAEHVADDRSGEIGDRARLEEVEIVGDVGEILAGRIGHGIKAIALRPIFFGSGQSIRPHDRPCRGRAFACDGSRGLGRVHALLRGDAKERDHVRILRRVVGLPIAHALVFHDAGTIAFGSADGDGRRIHRGSPFAVSPKAL